MLAHSPRDRSRSPHNSTDGISSTNQSNQNDSSSQIESTDNGKIKKENDSQQRMKSLKLFIQTLINESKSIGTTYDEQMKTLESACIEEYRDLSVDRIRRMIRSALKLRKTQPSSSSSTNLHTTGPFLHKDHKKNLLTTNERFNSHENNVKKNRSNSISNNSTTKTADLVSSPSSSSSAAAAATLSAFDADFLRHAFSQQFRPSLDLSAYFSTATTTPTNGTNSNTSLFRPNFSPTNFLQSLTNTTSLAPPIPPPPPIFVSSQTNTNGTSDCSSSKSLKPTKLSSTEMSSIKVLVHAYREAASYLSRSADELEQLI